MLTEKDLKELLSFQSSQPVLSVYLNTDPTSGSADVYRLSLRTMLKNVDLPADVAAVENFIKREFNWSGKSVILFSCAADDFFRAYSLAIPIHSRVRIANSPHVKPLANLLDFYGGYGVILVDKQGARLFFFHLGELGEQEGFLGESIKRTKRGGSSSLPGRRGGMAGKTNYIDEQTDRNMKEMAEVASQFFTENNVRRILIGGTDDNVAQFRSLLSKSWQSLIVGTFPISMTAKKDEVLARALEAGHAAELTHEKHLLDVIITSTAKLRGGVHHLNETLQAVHDGRVQTLLIYEGFRAAGRQCQGCGFLTATYSKKCPYCDGNFKSIPDAVELAVRNVMKQGGEVEVTQQERALKEMGGIGAILRY